VADALLNRYGVVFRSLLQREPRFIPAWRELTHIYRRMEARGEIRGGRFVSGFSGEQFALPGAVAELRATRRQATDDREIVVAAADPLNLSGIITPGPRVPVAARNRLLYRNGVPVAVYIAGDFAWLEPADAAREWSARNRLIRNDPSLTWLPGSERPS
jgi:ATP-dependent Lhr-like helicase